MRIALLLLPVLVHGAAFFETGAVRQSDDGAYHINAYPQVNRLASGRLLAVWSVQAKGSRDSRVAAALSNDGGRTWSEPKTLVDHPTLFDGDPNTLLDGKRVFVYVTSRDINPPFAKSMTFMTRSDDEGLTWSAPVEIAIPRNYVSGKQHNGIKLRDGSLFMGICWDLWAEKGTAPGTESSSHGVVAAMRSGDGVDWSPFGELSAHYPKVSSFSVSGLDEPSFVELEGGEIFMLMRSGTARHREARSRDGGITWSLPKPSALTGHNTPANLWRLDGSPEIVVIWNHSPINRYPLSVALSADGGRTWSPPRNVAESDGPQISYPGIAQAADRTFVAVWQQQLKEGGRAVRWARFNREWVLEGK
ncbi:MAG: sialidase family protein [Bryobacteraceae bacterium]